MIEDQIVVVHMCCDQSEREEFAFHWRYSNGAVGYGGEKTSEVYLGDKLMVDSYKAGLPDPYNTDEYVAEHGPGEEMSDDEFTEWATWYQDKLFPNQANFGQAVDMSEYDDMDDDDYGRP